MISKKLRQVMAGSMAVVMTASLAACGEKKADPTPAPQPTQAPTKQEETKQEDTKPEYSPEGYKYRYDENGNLYDLGGIEVIIRDWWSGDGARAENPTSQQQAEYDYQDWCMDTYNFTIKRQTVSQWGNVPQDLIDYASTGGDENNYVFVLYQNGAVYSAMTQGYMYDLASLKGAINLEDEKWQTINIHSVFGGNGHAYAVASGKPEPRPLLFFNKRLLKDAGIDPQELYDMQEKKTWTWDAWEAIMDKVQRDIDNDGVIDVWALLGNQGLAYDMYVASNGGSYVGIKDGKLFNNLESQATLTALQRCYDNQNKYYKPKPNADAAWDWYKEAYNRGEAVFLPEEQYYAQNLKNEMTDEYGAVVFPIGPNAGGEYISYISDNIHCIPSCYSADRAWKIAFAYDLFTEPLPDADPDAWLNGYYNLFCDAESVDGAVRITATHGATRVHGFVPGIDLGNDLTYGKFGGDNTAQTAAQRAEELREKWNAAIDEFNNK